MSDAHTKNLFRAGFLIHDASRLRRTALDQRLKPLGITRSQWWVMTHISRVNGEALSQVELARLLDVGKVTLGGLIDRLERGGLVERCADGDDRRLKRIRMSRRGRALFQRIEGIAADVNRESMEGISAEDEARLMEILAKMKHNLKRMDAVPVTTPRKAPSPA
jgi:DNA-binding MarR family transcriptional regulator